MCESVESANEHKQQISNITIYYNKTSITNKEKSNLEKPIENQYYWLP
jgi:hypothetical protein